MKQLPSDEDQGNPVMSRMQEGHKISYKVTDTLRSIETSWSAHLNLDLARGIPRGFSSKSGPRGVYNFNCCVQSVSLRGVSIIVCSLARWRRLVLGTAAERQRERNSNSDYVRAFNLAKNQFRYSIFRAKWSKPWRHLSLFRHPTWPLRIQR